jgi:hypothetical protein
MTVDIFYIKQTFDQISNLYTVSKFASGGSKFAFGGSKFCSGCANFAQGEQVFSSM